MKRMLAAFCVLALAGADKADEKKADELEGTWIVESAQIDGVFQKAWVDGKVVCAPGGKMKILWNDGSLRVLEYSSDAAKTPKTLDGTLVEGSSKWIYSLDGDTLRLCTGAPGAAAFPKEFTAKKGSKQLLLILKRQKM